MRLIGTLYTRSLARRYLSTTLVNKWYPFHCFQLVCELLYGRVPCYVIYTRDVVDDGSKVNAKDNDLVLSKVRHHYCRNAFKKNTIYVWVTNWCWFPCTVFQSFYCI